MQYPTLTCPQRQPRRTALWLVAMVLFVLSILVAPRTVAGDESSAPRVPEVADLAALQQAFQSVVDRVAPSVVGIRVERRPADSTALGESSGLERHIIVNGSGTILTADGLILTNEHVVRGADTVDIRLHDGTRLVGQTVQADARSDLAIVRIPRTNLVPAPLCDWSAVGRGQWTIVLGNPYGLGNDGRLSVAVGIVSNLDRQLPGLGEADDRFYNHMIQTTAAIKPGDSGGPLFNIRGELIGVVTAMHTRAPADGGIGFAIPMNAATRRLVDILCQGRAIEYGYLGMTVRLPEAGERDVVDAGGGHGVVVENVEADGPAAAAGLQVGDVIRTYGQETIDGPAQFAELVGQTPVGSQVRLDCFRDGTPLALDASVGRRDIVRVTALRARGAHGQTR